jgi:hypothetical protein
MNSRSKMLSKGKYEQKMETRSSMGRRRLALSDDSRKVMHVRWPKP